MRRPVPSQCFPTILLALVLRSNIGQAQNLSFSQDRFDVTVDADTIPSGGLSQLFVSAPDRSMVLRFRALPSVTNAISGGRRFLIVGPARGTTPTVGGLALDPTVVPFLPPGIYTATFAYVLDPPNPPVGFGRGGFFTLRIRAPPPPIVTWVVGIASQATAISPGGAVSIFGTNLGSPAESANFDEFGVYPAQFGNSTVTFNGVAAPLTYVSGTRIDALVPFNVAGHGTVRVVVNHHSQQSAEFNLPLQETSPGILTGAGSGNSQGGIFQTPRFGGNPLTLNSSENPIEKGGAIVVFATGVGLWNQEFEAGQIVFGGQIPAVIVPKAEVSLKIDGIPATIFYAGAAKGRAGVIQVNAFVPEAASSGIVSLELVIGNHSNAAQNVTLAIQ